MKTNTPEEYQTQQNQQYPPRRGRGRGHPRNQNTYQKQDDVSRSEIPSESQVSSTGYDNHSEPQNKGRSNRGRGGRGRRNYQPVDGTQQGGRGPQRGGRGSQRGRGGRGRRNYQPVDDEEKLEKNNETNEHNQVQNDEEEEYFNEQESSNKLRIKDRHLRKNIEITQSELRVPKEKSSNISSFGAEPRRRPSTDDKEEMPTKAKRTNRNDKLRELISGQSKLATQMIEQILSSSYECLVCVKKIGFKSATWNCKTCYRLFHIGCIKKWMKSSVLDGSWRCPGCRELVINPPLVECYCGKRIEPQSDPFLVPRSCGEMCGRKRGGNCTHPCALLCHPGPCPDCPAMAQPKDCFCGKTKYQKPCAVSDNGQSCGKICGKLLNCGKHNCSLVCHDGKCEKCPIMVEMACYCSKDKKMRPCGSEQTIDKSHGVDDIRSFSCGKICDRKLGCGNHNCILKCHPSASETEPTCPKCPLLPSEYKTCACGKTRAELFPPRKSCLDEIHTCVNVCGKKLKCGKHKCPLPCHNGDCLQDCEELVNVPCRCGNPQGNKKMKCKDVYPGKRAQLVKENLCHRLCKKSKECGRHECSIRCCPSQREDPEGNHVCRLSCGRTLSCRNHQCELPCHSGNCPPCLNFILQDRICPCGRTVQKAPIACGSEPKKCKFPCPVVPKCGHPPVLHECHWKGECPSCVYLVDKICCGGHTTVKAVACFLPNPSCGRTCGKKMYCGSHICSRVCHPGECELPLKDDHNNLIKDPDYNSNVQSCGQQCKKKLKNCQHECVLTCHPGKLCPEGKCKKKTIIYCPCKRLTNEVPCIGLRKIDLVCDDICKKETRQKLLAEALGILPTTKAPEYTELLLNFAKAAPHFIMDLEKKLKTFMQSNNQVLRFPSMDSVHRRVIFQYARYFYLDAEMLGPESSKYMQLKKKQGCRLPTVLLSQILAAEQKQQNPERSKIIIVPHHALQIYGLTPKVNNDHLETFLKPFEDKILQWVDDENALIIFKSEAQMKDALALLSDSVFKVRPYKDSLPQPGRDGNIALKQNTSKPNPPQEKKEEFALRDNGGNFKPGRSQGTQNQTVTLVDQNKFILLNGVSDEELLWEKTKASKQAQRPAENNKTNKTSEKTQEEIEGPAVVASVNWEDLLDDEN